MTDLQLFKCSGTVTELPAKPVDFERELQSLIERNMDVFFGVRFLQSEFSISSGRIDSLGLDENNCPVVFEYKRNSNENVVNQGLFYLDWLLDHKADFKMLVMEVIDKETANSIDWLMPQVICIASDFNKYDRHAVKQMQRNIKLVRYKKYENDLILFEHINTPDAKSLKTSGESTPSSRSDKTFEEKLKTIPKEILNIYNAVSDFVLSLGDDVTENRLKFYVAFKKVKNVICAQLFMKSIILNLRLNPDEIELIENFTRNMRGVGKGAPGDLEVTIKSMEDFEKAKPLIEKAYNEN
jgi:predicted transport protein